MRVQPDYLPTAADIASACLLIQATWSEGERRRRARGIIREREPATAEAFDRRMAARNRERRTRYHARRRVALRHLQTAFAQP